MKTSSIIKITAWAIVLLFLAALLVAELTGNGVLKNFGFITFDTDWTANLGKGFDGEISQTGSEVVAADDVEKIDVLWLAKTVTIVPYEGEDIKFEQSDFENLSEHRRLRFKIENGVLKISDNEGGRIKVSPSDNSVLTIYLPEKKAFSSVYIKTVSADIDAQSLIADSIYLDSVSGDIELLSPEARTIGAETVSGSFTAEEASSEDLSFESVSGRLNFSGSADTVDIETVSGSAELELLACPSRFSADTVSGNITLRIPENDGFTAKLSKVSGGLVCDFPGTVQKDSVSYKNGAARFDCNSVSGSFYIRRVN